MSELTDALRQLGRTAARPAESVTLVLGGVVVAGLLTLVLAWRGAARNIYVPFQTPWLISGGLAGLALLVIGLGLLTTHLNRVDEARHRSEREEALREAIALLTVAPTLRARRQQHVVLETIPVATRSRTMHRTDCRLLPARDDIRHLRRTELPSGLRACRICKPDPL